MTLVLRQQVETSLLIDVTGIIPEHLVGLSMSDLSKQTVGYGNTDVELGELFKVSGKLSADDRAQIRWEGNLRSVHGIGAGMTSGKMEVTESAGRHLGSQMSGGEIVVQGDVGDYTGAEMTGGTIRVFGNAGDLLGANYPGSKFGMNRGSIVVSGNAGKGVGQSLRRGTIVVGGSCGTLAGWDMLGGTLISFGRCDKDCGANMKRGTIVLAACTGQPLPSLPTFTRGGTNYVPIFRTVDRWLQRQGFDIASTNLAETKFTQFHGDVLQGGRGEVFLIEN